MNAKELSIEYSMLYGKYVALEDDNYRLGKRVDELSNEIAELEWKWEELCKSKGLKVIKEER